jgi:16S rRNA (cytosine1402-N4)-methyltransferase
MQHYPVMAAEALEHLAIRPHGIYIDATAGLGGHTGQIAARLTTGLVIANDRDELSLAMARQSTAEWSERIRYHRGTFATLADAMVEAGVKRVDGLLADLGVSRYQLTSPERGFSFLSDGPLDMRLDQSSGVTAADLVNYMPERALADLIFQLGEERRARRIARAIVRARPLRSTLHLADVVERAAPRTSRIHPATQTFMALRMKVNEEPEELDRLLAAAPDLLHPGGRLVVISFMSSDDRKVKERFRQLARDGKAVLLTKRPLEPSDQETAQNPASRSAKLRALEVIEEE